MVFEKRIIHIKNDFTCVLRPVEVKDAAEMIDGNIRAKNYMNGLAFERLERISVRSNMTMAVIEMNTRW